MMAGSRLTVEAFYQRRDEWPEGGRWCELIEGEVFELSPPDVMHSGVVLNLASKLGVYAQETQNGYACFDIGFVVARCPDTMRMINIAYFTAESRCGLSDVGYSERPPALAVELASSRDRQETMSQRVDEFLSGGVPLVWVLDTVGTNLLDILALDFVNSSRTISNHIIEIYNVLGIEAARQAIFDEFSEVIEFDSTYINYHHLTMLCDRMTCNDKMVSIFRHGINNDNIGAIAKASFEETPEMFLRAARHGELDIMRGVSANVMCGQQGYYGTGSFQVLLNIKEMNKLGDQVLQKKINISQLIQSENPNDICSKQNIIINNTTENLKGINTGNVSTDYDPGF